MAIQIWPGQQDAAPARSFPARRGGGHRDLLGAQGVGFSVRSNTARLVVSQLLTHERVRWGYPGIAGRGRRLDRRLVLYHELVGEHAVEVVSVGQDSPSARAGMEAGDLILGIDGSRVPSVDDIDRHLVDWIVGQTVTVNVLRDRERVSLEVVPCDDCEPQPAADQIRVSSESYEWSYRYARQYHG